MEPDWSALASKSRRLILLELANGERTVTELTKACGLGQPATSQHLAILREAGLISGRSEPRPDKMGGAWRIYRLAPQGIERMRGQYDDFLTSIRERCPLCGPGYRLGVEGCRHGVST